MLEGIDQFRVLEGGKLVVEVLEDRDRGEEERREAAGVLAQVRGRGYHGRFLNSHDLFLLNEKN